MRVIRSAYRGAAEWRAQRTALLAAAVAVDAAPLEPAVVVSRPGEHAQGAGVLVEAVGPDGRAVYEQLLSEAGRGPAALEEAIEATIQEAWRQLVQQVGRPADDSDDVQA